MSIAAESINSTDSSFSGHTQFGDAFNVQVSLSFPGLLPLTAMSAGGSCGSLRKAGHGRPQAVRFHCRVLSVHVGVCAPDRDEDTQDF